jgi:hypothetical protein
MAQDEVRRSRGKLLQQPARLRVVVVEVGVTKQLDDAGASSRMGLQEQCRKVVPSFLLAVRRRVGESENSLVGAARRHLISARADPVLKAIGHFEQIVAVLV